MSTKEHSHGMAEKETESWYDRENVYHIKEHSHGMQKKEKRRIMTEKGAE
jgi:hypothetical protein